MAENDSGTTTQTTDPPKGVDFTDDQKNWIKSVLRKERRRHEQELADLRDELKDTESGKPPPFDQDGNDGKGAGGSQVQQLRDELAEERRLRESDKVTARAVEVALAKGVNPKRAAALVGLAKLDKVRPTDTERIVELVEAAVEEYPEFKAAPAKTDDDPPKNEPKNEARPAASGRDDSGSAPPSTKNDNVGAGRARLTAAYAEQSSQAS